MNLIIPSIAWSSEDKERILTVAVHPTEPLLLTGGSDQNMKTDSSEDSVGYIKMWDLSTLSNVALKFIGAINYGHEASVNCLRFSPNGTRFASASDDKSVKLWERKMKTKFSGTEPTLQWCDTGILLGHTKEVYDLAWSKDGTIIVSCGLDKNILIWDTKKCKQLQALDGHTSYVQGVMIDPRLKYIISLSQDRTARVWKSQKVQGKSAKNRQFYNAFIVRKQDEKHGMFIGDSNFSFFRRPDWSPEGSMFILPAAEYWVEEVPTFGVYLFLRQNPNTPAMFIKTNKPAVAVKFCPKLYIKTIQSSLIDIPYKMIFAIATVDQIILYSTEESIPFAIFDHLHYAAITDLTFTPKLIAASSCDGYCSFVKIEDGYFGQEFNTQDLPSYIRDAMTIEEKKIEEVPKPAVPIILEQQVVITTENGVVKKQIIPSRIA